MIDRKNKRGREIILRIVLYAGCILLLLAVVSPSCSGRQERMIRIGRAETEAAEICGAIKQYEVLFAHFPVTNSLFCSADSMGVRLLESLSGGQGESGRAGREVGIECALLLDPSYRTGVKDPWGCPYNVSLDQQSNGLVRIGDNRLAARIAVWSNGPNRRDDSGLRDDIVCRSPARVLGAQQTGGEPDRVGSGN